MSQREMILVHLQMHGGISAAEAMNRYGIGRLAARIADLRKAGYPVADVWVTAKNRYGKPVRYKKYVLGRTRDEGHISEVYGQETVLCEKENEH
jgi:hypothetical protein